MSWLSGTTELVTGGWLSSGYPGLGATGAAIKAASVSGEHGAGVGMNDGLIDASEYIFEVAAHPTPSGAVDFIDELGRSTLTVSADGTYTWGYSLRENGVYQTPNPVTVTVTVGAATITGATANCSQGNASSAVAGSTSGAVVGAVAGCSQGNACSAVSGSVSSSTITGYASSCAQASACTSALGVIVLPGVLPSTISLARTYQVPSDTSISIYGAGLARPFYWLMDQEARLDFACDWGAWLTDAGDTLASVQVTADTEGLRIDEFGVVQNTKAAAVVQALALGTWRLELKINTSAGRIDERTIYIEVINR